MGMPKAGWCDEGSTALPVDPLRIKDLAAAVQFSSHQGVTARITVEDQIEGH
jgi:hypothetical protein